MKPFLTTILLSLSSLTFASPFGEIPPGHTGHACDFSTPDDNSGVFWITIEPDADGSNLTQKQIDESAAELCSKMMGMNCTATCKQIDKFPSRRDLLEMHREMERKRLQDKKLDTQYI